MFLLEDNETMQTYAAKICTFSIWDVDGKLGDASDFVILMISSHPGDSFNDNSADPLKI